jgi:hypothetical protein
MSARPTTEPVIRVVAMPADTNPHGDIFGGWLMSLMDVGAGTVAMRVCNGRAVTVAVDGMQFLAPVAVGDEVSVFGTLLATGARTENDEIVWVGHLNNSSEIDMTGPPGFVDGDESKFGGSNLFGDIPIPQTPPGLHCDCD